jgi:heme A synthase
MNALRRLSYTSLILGFGHIVFGAIVRITGSGLGCGDHWPTCRGYWFPPLDRPDLVIELSHRYFAVAVSVAIVALVAAAYMRRREPGVGSEGGVLRPALLALGLVLAAAIFGAVTVKLELTNKSVIVIHLAIAMALLAVLVVAVQRAGGLGASAAGIGTTSRRTWRGARAAVALAFVALVLGALTANLPGASSACEGFPLCRGSWLPSGNQHTQYTHRILAFLLLFHVTGVVIGVRRRGEARVIIAASRAALGAIILQIVIAAAMVEMQLPPILRSLHEAAGTLVWVAIVVFAALARRGALGVGVGARLKAPGPLVGAEAV